jgi:hypothetical protein
LLGDCAVICATHLIGLGHLHFGELGQSVGGWMRSKLMDQEGT